MSKPTDAEVKDQLNALATIRSFAVKEQSVSDTKPTKPRLSWRKQPSEGGLRSVGQAPRGAILKVNGEDVGRVCANRVGFSREYKGWWWYAGGRGVPLRNECDKPVKDVDEAKRQCEAYVRECLGMPAAGAKTK